MKRRAFLIGSGCAALAGCAASGPVHFDRMMHVTPDETGKMLGRWSGPFEPVDPGGEPGIATLDVTRVDGTLMHATMTWMRGDEVWDRRELTAALAQGTAGHYNFLYAHAMIHQKGPEAYILVTTYLKDGRRYRHRLARTDVTFDHEADYQHA